MDWDIIVSLSHLWILFSAGSGYEISGQKEIYIDASGDEIKDDEGG